MRFGPILGGGFLLRITLGGGLCFEMNLGGGLFLDVETGYSFTAGRLFVCLLVLALVHRYEFSSLEQFASWDSRNDAL